MLFRSSDSTTENPSNNGENNNLIIHEGSIPNVLIDPQTSSDLIGSFNLVKTIDTRGNIDIPEAGAELIRVFYDDLGDINHLIVVRYDDQHMVLYDEASGFYDEYRRVQ